MSIDTVIMEEDHPMLELLEELEYTLEKGVYGCGSLTHLRRARLIVLALQSHETLPHVEFRNVESYIEYWEDQFSPFPMADIPMLPPREVIASDLGGSFHWRDHSGNPGHSTWELVE